MKTNTDIHPFNSFEWFLDEQIYKELRKFDDADLASKELYGLIKHIDKEKLQITFDSYDGICTYNFETDIKSQLKPKILNTIEIIEAGFEKRFKDKKEVKAYANFLRIKLDTLSKKDTVAKFSFLNTYIEQFQTLINQYSQQSINYSFVPSFELLSDAPKNQLTTIKSLYLSLTESPSMINCSEEEFVKAFTGQELDEGIHWLVLGKNKKYSKPSLFYLINNLIDANFISKTIINDLNKYVGYVFRDNHGNYIENIKQSKSYISKNPASKDRIDSIIEQLQK